MTFFHEKGVETRLISPIIRDSLLIWLYWVGGVGKKGADRY